MSAAKSGKWKKWELDLLSHLAKSGESGAWASRYIINNNISFVFRKQRTGARWTIWGMLFRGLLGKFTIELSTDYLNDSLSANRWVISLIAHEAKHFQQGFIRALSKYGELEAWQFQIQVLRDMNYSISPILEAIEEFELSHDREVLFGAADLMVKYDPIYKVHLLPPWLRF